MRYSFNRMNDKQQYTDVYNKQAKDLLKKYATFPARVEDIEMAFALLGEKENPFVVEIGCAQCRDGKEILNRTDRYLGIDISEEFIKIAKEEVPEGQFEVADAEVFEFPQGIDLIFAFASLLHSDKEALKSILDRAHAAMNLGGIFYLSLKSAPYQKLVKKDQFGTRVFIGMSWRIFESWQGRSLKWRMSMLGI